MKKFIAAFDGITMSNVFFFLASVSVVAGLVTFAVSDKVFLAMTFLVVTGIFGFVATFKFEKELEGIVNQQLSRGRW